jgi:hypothetical protein
VSNFYTYICTKSTADPYLAPRAVSMDILSRDVSDAFSALSGGRFEVGKLAFYPAQRSVPNHLLCDGREVEKASFPELYSYLGDQEGAASGPDSFKLPNFLTGFVPSTTAVPETTNQGTVSTPPPVVPPPTYDEDRTDRLYGNVDSGGRYRLNNPIP